MAEKKFVLMIDDSAIVDRRILLEAKTLQSLGMDVVLVCPARNQSDEGEQVVRGVRIHKVLVSSEAGNVHLEQPVANATAPRQKLKHLLKRFPRIFGFFRSIFRFGMEVSYKARYLPDLCSAYLAMFAGSAETHFLKLSPAHELFFDFVKRKFDHVDVVHAHDLSILNVGVLLKKHFSAKLVFDAHEVYGLQYRRYDPLRYLYNLKERYLAGNADAVVTVNSDCVRLIQRNLLNRGMPFYEISNAVNLPTDFEQLVAARRGHLKAFFGIPSSSRILIFTGGINTLRKVHLLIEAMKDTNPDIHLVLMPLPYQVKEFKELAIKFGVGNRVHFGPFVDSEEVLYWIADADVGIMPYQPVVESIAVSSPNKMFEFIACGLPMIGSTELQNVAHVIESNGAGVTYRLRKAPDYTVAICKMFDDSLGGHERFRVAIQAIQDRFSWKHQELTLKRCYDELRVI